MGFFFWGVGKAYVSYSCRDRTSFLCTLYLVRMGMGACGYHNAKYHMTKPDRGEVHNFMRRFCMGNENWKRVTWDPLGELSCWNNDDMTRYDSIREVRGLKA